MGLRAWHLPLLKCNAVGTDLVAWMAMTFVVRRVATHAVIICKRPVTLCPFRKKSRKRKINNF